MGVATTGNTDMLTQRTTHAKHNHGKPASFSTTPKHLAAAHHHRSDMKESSDESHGVPFFHLVQ
jgi:hypothetical protein